MYAAVIALFLVGVIVVYFCSNPLHHSRWFLIRRFINWFPLGMTYAFLYMGRYNLQVSKNALGILMTKEDFGTIAAAGTITYAVSFVVNGPLVDRIGGKRGILISSLGASLANIMLGILTYLVVTGHKLTLGLVPAYSVLYALNMYFQSYGAVSIIKIKAYWFHVRERGVFGAIFGSLISIGIYFAIDWGGSIADMTKANPGPDSGWLHRLIQQVFASKTAGTDASWAIFFVPAIILLFWFAVDWVLIKDAPDQAGFPPFDTADASSGQMHITLTTLDLLKKVFTSPLMIMIAFAELTAGVFRDGIQNWYIIFSKEVPQPSAHLFANHFGFLLCIFGIIGGFAAGLTSDRLFQSRRGPPVAVASGIVLVAAAIMACFLYRAPVIAGSMAILIVMCAVGITSLMSGTAAADFGGRKATATCMGIVDGFAYVGSGLQVFCLGRITTWHWRLWPVFFIPFAVLGLTIAIRIWNALPAATRKYIVEVEEKRLAPPAPIG
jgi:OPA family glycerol-3-phosphate transporter-like MFS transporter